MFSFVSTLAR